MRGHATRKSGDGAESIAPLRSTRRFAAVCCVDAVGRCGDMVAVMKFRPFGRLRPRAQSLGV